MPLPDRPVSGASIESVWGQTIHDYTLAPAGCRVHGTTNASVGTSLSKMTLSVADDDPGGYLDAGNNQVEIPTDGGGLYVAQVDGWSIDGSAGTGFKTRLLLDLNGTFVAAVSEDNNGGTTIYLPITWIYPLVAGDILSVYAQRIGAGTSPDVTVGSFVLVRIGDDFGAP